MMGRQPAWARHAGLLALAVILLAACGAPTDEPEPTILTVEHAGFRLTVPDGWSAEPTNNIAGQLQTVAFLSNLPLDLKCRGLGTTRECREPRSLEEGSLLVTWLASFCVSCSPPTGQPFLVGSREASLVSDSTLCQGLEPTDEETYFVVVTPQRLDAIVVCKRDAPDTADAALRAMLEHVEWSTP
jgi:hypothetical protein